MLKRLGSAAMVVGLLAGGAEPAAACGGTFCDTGPTAMPVDQTGENILFVVKDTTVEAHIQIQYAGAAERFAWIIPMAAEPDVRVGSQPLFDALLASTVPTIGYQTQFDFCSNGFGGTASGGAGGASSFGFADAGASGVNVLFQKTVGTFEVTALTGGTAQQVVDWLATNGYENIDTAPAILQRYVDRGSVFVAVKLTAGAAADSIHPLVFEYAGNEPCIPLELTAVAAVEDMGVRAFFLGDDRVVPTRYRHVTMNPARLDWLSFGDNYNALVSRAVDEAGGRAFVTEYAGASGIVSRQLLDSRWVASAFVGLNAAEAVKELEGQGLLDCYETYLVSGYTRVCSASHPLVLPLLREYAPAPSGIDESMYYGCLACDPTLQACPGNDGCDAVYIAAAQGQGAGTDAGAVDGGTDGGASAPLSFDSAGFSADFEDRIVLPAMDADALFQRWPYLTRLFTTISPSEMTSDPFFTSRSDLPEVALPTQATYRRTDSGNGMILPGGRQVAIESVWPAFTSQMPWAERVEEFTETTVDVVSDNAAQIDAQLDAWNGNHGWPPPPLDCTAVGTGGASSGSGATGGANSGSGGTGPSVVGGDVITVGGSQSGDGGIAPEGSTDDGSCSCRIGARSTGGSGWGAALVGVLGIAWSRRRRARR